MGTARDELKAMIEDHWNPMAEQVPYARPVKDKGLMDWLWKRLRYYEGAIIRQGMDDEFAEKRPDIRRLVERCALLCPPPQSETMTHRGRYDISRVWPYDMTGDPSAFARHVCDSKILDAVDPAWYDKAIRLLQQGCGRRYLMADGSVYPLERAAAGYVERKALAVRMLRGRTPEQLRQEARAWVDKIFGPVGGQPVRGDLDKLFRDEDVSDVIPF